MKGATMKFIAANAQDVMISESFSLLRESSELMEKVMQAMANQMETLKRKRDE